MNITPEQFLDIEVNKLNLTLKNEPFVRLAEEVANVVKSYNPASVIDYGCGTGVYAEIMRRAGLNVTAYDIWSSHRDYCTAQYPDLNVTDKLQPHDFMTFIEVAEHMTDDEIKAALKAINPKYILFSSTPEKDAVSETGLTDEDWGHINVKTEREWIYFFENPLGYFLTDAVTVPTVWSLLFKKIP